MAETQTYIRWFEELGSDDTPMDMEWAKDGETGDLYIVQARPETVQSQKEAGSLKTYPSRRKANVSSRASASARRLPPAKPVSSRVRTISNSLKMTPFSSRK